MHNLLRLLVVAALPAVADVATNTPAPAAPAPPMVLGPATNWIALGRVQVDPLTKTVIATGFVNQVEGLVELLVCGPGGKRHESVFVLQSAAADLQSALLLIGATNGPAMTEMGKGPPSGRAVTIEVQTGAPGTGVVQSAAVFLRHTEKGVLPADTPWVFTGSVLEQGEFKAAVEESFVASYWDPWAIINIGSPLGAEDDFLAVNRELIPAIETPVTLLFRCRP